ncbi:MULTISPECIES: RICIN domain-containing protein [Streptomyces]|uniref:RICIN domain-containing protein n=1 Tax=Streptomyces TaxID=1883 RepID=UPI00163B76E7|nr:MULTISPECIES: RICIN domain-containing protein [Streptomyces]MBC2875378.1 RICIN domain-containing protein [Streptomyces sp. TYQ1024]UBI35623.1 RICIN domain-containing protein [Streptomyces mobaraensis]UKW28218.1 RICIN domain-containing protein [Streptomyces sp. TYQ1024]
MGIPAEGTYLLKNFAANLYAGTKGRAAQPATIVEQWSLLREGERESQVWRLPARTGKDAKEGDCFLVNVHSGLRLYIKGNELNVSRDAYAELWNGDQPEELDSPTWRITEEGSGLYALCNRRSGHWLRIRDFNPDPGMELEQGEKDEDQKNRAYALWHVEPVDAQGKAIPGGAAPGKTGEQTGSGQTTPTAEPGVCGTKRESYLGTYQGTYKREPSTGVMRPTFEGRIGDAFAQIGAYLDSGTWDMTARFFMDGNTTKVETTFRLTSGSTQVHGRGYSKVVEYRSDLRNRCVNFVSQAESTPEEGGEFDYQVPEPGVSKKGHLGGYNHQRNVEFILSAADPPSGNRHPAAAAPEHHGLLRCAAHRRTPPRGLNSQAPRSRHGTLQADRPARFPAVARPAVGCPAFQLVVAISPVDSAGCAGRASRPGR